MAKDASGRAREEDQGYLGGAVGAGLVLIVLPCLALYFGIDKLGATPAMGLPILAIFGIMILFGALAIVSTLFARLGLDDPTQALALPEGSIRAAIALALIVLFAIIAIMLYQSGSKPYVITGLGEAAKSDMVRDAGNHVIAVVPEPCAFPAAVPRPDGASEKCAPANLRFSVHVRLPAGQESTDLAKQLLILIGTLMTSVTSFYFASRATEGKRNAGSSKPAGDGSVTSPQAAQAASLATGQPGDDNDVDGCDAPIANATPDEELPAAKGGVA